ncbi:hypothetical protein [Acinetobacter soli]|uniref:hypothetical protein n=1 Tax=Acinetobacter soli TaxID=487316 RepID=UPI00124F86EB|nr:hypothetical protein [Acinetobacter soli]
MKQSHHSILKTVLLLTIGLFSHLTFANIPSELLYQPPQDTPVEQRASIQGFIKTSTPLKFIDALVYLTYINDKATLNHSSNWDKVYEIKPGLNDIRIVSDTQNYFTSGRLSFTAKPGQHYQVKNNQADIKVNKELMLFWIENIDTGEIITPKQELVGVTTPSTVNFIPVIISK